MSCLTELVLALASLQLLGRDAANHHQQLAYSRYLVCMFTSTLFPIVFHLEKNVLGGGGGGGGGEARKL